MAVPAARPWRILWPCEPKRRALAFFGVNPRTATVRFDNPAHDGKADTGALDPIA
jgi:hypothetical protein